MKKSYKSIRNIESKFDEKDIFFSTTDLKGIILSGNSVFYNVAKYSPEELIGSPHNIVRHPDMPKVVFKLLWEYIQNKKKIGAYVKNLAKDGSFYWVFALVLPIVDRDSGKIKKYLSMRIKPTTRLKETVERLYKDILEIEKNKGVEAAESYLIYSLNKLGFESYDDFMYYALKEEVLSKKDVFKSEKIYLLPKTHFEKKIYSLLKSARVINNIYDGIFFRINKFEDFGSILQEKSEVIFNLTDKIRLISLNSSVESFKLGSKGASFSVLASEMRRNSEFGSKVIEDMRHTIGEISNILDELIHSITISKLEILTVNQFLEETISKGKDTYTLQNMKNLLFLLNNAVEKDVELALKMRELLLKISEDIKKLKSLIKSLEFLYINGMIESSYQKETGFSIIFTEVNKLVDTAKNVVFSVYEPLMEVIEENKKSIAGIRKISVHIQNMNRTFGEIYIENT